MKKAATKIMATAILVLTYVFGAFAGVIAPGSMPVPNVLQGHYVSDPEGILSDETVRSVDALLDEVKRTTSAEVGVAMVPDLGDMEVEEYANALYDTWKLGKANNNNGVLLIISPGSRQARIQTGYGTEGVLPDMLADRIMRDRIIPAMRRGDPDAAVKGAVSDIAGILTDPEYAEELRSEQTRQEVSIGLTPKEKEALKTAFGTVATIAFVAGLVVLLWGWRHYRRRLRRDRVAGWRSLCWILVVLGVVSLGAGMLWALIGWLAYSRTRKKGDPCPNCGYDKTRQLHGNEATVHLTPAQQTENRLDSRRHDVWHCDRCGQTTVDSFDNPFSNYTVCDRCGTKAMRPIGSRTLRPAGTFTSGEGEKIFKCEHCGHQNRRKYVIPKTAARDAALLGILGAAGRRGRGGGGGFGGGGFGGFGGGMSGGGGASGRW